MAILIRKDYDEMSGCGLSIAEQIRLKPILSLLSRLVSPNRRLSRADQNVQSGDISFKNVKRSPL